MAVVYCYGWSYGSGSGNAARYRIRHRAGTSGGAGSGNAITFTAAYVVKWFNDQNRLLAQGQRAGDGAVACAAVNGSGLSVACDIAYTADVTAFDAFLDLKWPAWWRLFWSVGAIDYDATPQALLPDDGSEAHECKSAVLDPGAYNYNVIPVDDDGDPQATPGAPADSPVTIAGPPESPVIESVENVGITAITPSSTAADHESNHVQIVLASIDPNLIPGIARMTLAGWTWNNGNGNVNCTSEVIILSVYDTKYIYVASVPTKPNLGSHPSVIGTISELPRLRVNFTGDAAATHQLYASPVNGLVDFGSPTAATLPSVDIAIPSYTTQDDTAAWAALLAAWDAAVADAVATWPGMLFDCITLTDAVEAALATFVAATGMPLMEITADLAAAGASAAGNIAAAASNANAAAAFGAYLQYLGSTLEDNPARYSLADGTPAGSGTLANTGRSLLQAALPLVKPNYLTLVMRSTLAGVQERADVPYVVELSADETGDIVEPKPANVMLTGYALSNVAGVRTLAATAAVEDDHSEPATYLDLYVVPAGDSIDPDTPTQSQAVQVGPFLSTATFIAVPVTAGAWYQVAVMARAANGARSASYEVEYVYVSADTPAAAAGLAATVTRDV